MAYSANGNSSALNADMQSYGNNHTGSHAGERQKEMLRSFEMINSINEPTRITSS